MKPYNANGMLAFWTDIDDEHLVEIQKWHNCEHMTERVGLPGFIVGRRYRGVDNAPTFFISYDTTDTEVLRSEPYLHALNNSTPWTKYALKFFKNNIRNSYSMIMIKGTPAPTEAPYCFVIRFNIKTESETETLDCLQNTYLSAISSLSDVFRCRLYEIDEKISNIMTEEREIYGGGPGRQKYLLVFELASQYVPKGGTWQGVNAKYSHIADNLTDRYEEYSFLDFVMYAPQI